MNLDDLHSRSLVREGPLHALGRVRSWGARQYSAHQVQRHQGSIKSELCVYICMIVLKLLHLRVLTLQHNLLCLLVAFDDQLACIHIVLLSLFCYVLHLLRTREFSFHRIKYIRLARTATTWVTTPQ